MKPPGKIKVSLVPDLTRLFASFKTVAVLGEVQQERGRQDGLWGEQNHPDGNEEGVLQFRARASYYKDACARDVQFGSINWTNILLEEVNEALSEENPAKLRAELIQAAAVCAAWVEAIDRRTA